MSLITKMNKYKASRGVLFVFALLLSTIFTTATPVFAAGETYTYAQNGTKIVGTGGLLGSSDVLFSKSATSVYTGSAKITKNGTTCNIGLEISVGSQSSSGTISAPGYRNGIPIVSAPGSNPTPSCEKDFAAGISEFNKSISIGGSTSNSGGGTNVAETESQRQIVVTVYSEKPVSQLPTISATLGKSGANNQTKNISWNTAASAGSTRFEDNDPGQYTVCINPSNQFSFEGCKTVTKVSKQTAMVDFGSAATAYNEEGKLVNVVVRISIPGHTGTKVYGPADISIVNSSDSRSVASGTTNENSIGGDTGATPAQVITINSQIDNVEPGTYKACISGTDLCSADFTKVANTTISVDINVPENRSTELTADADGKETCNITGIGWIVCPVATFLAGVTDSAYALVEKLLVVSFKSDILDTTNPVYLIWSNIRNLANIAFIFAFFAIIFSQATSVGIGNYGIKKMLPRLVVAAILVNLSYYICIFAIDISNIIGAGIDGIIRSVPLEGGAGTSSDPASSVGTWTGVIVPLLAAGVGAAAVAAAGGVIGALAAALPFLVTALFAVITALVVLVARQAIIILLVIIAPLAFVAYILPNTEGLFEKWRKLFTTMLVFYPLVAILFAGSSVASSILRLTVPENGNDFSAELIKVMSLAVAALPLFGLPFILKFSGGVLGRIGGMINNPNKGPFDKLRKSAEATRDTAQANARQRALGKLRKFDNPANYNGKFGTVRRRTRGAIGALGLTASDNARNRQDRERALGEAKQAETRAGTEYYVNRVNNDAKYAGRMAGGSLIHPPDQSALSRINYSAEEALVKIKTEETNRALAKMISSGGFSPGSTYTVTDASGHAVVSGSGNPRDFILNGLAHPNGTLTIRNSAGIEQSFKAGDVRSALLSQTAKMGDIPLTEQVISMGGATEADMREFISYNISNYASKAPDYVKGEIAAFGAPPAKEVAGWHFSTAIRARDYANANADSAKNIAISLQQGLSNGEIRGELNRTALANLIDYNIATKTGSSAIWTQLSAADQADIVRLIETGK